MLRVLFKVVSFRDFFFDVYICLKAAQPGNLQMSNSLSKVGIGAGLVTRDTEDTNLFSVATNVPGNQEVRKGFKICVTKTPSTKQKGWVHPNLANSFISYPDKCCG